ncbi:deoxyribonuclease I-like 3 [Columba livia]|uniref:Deoxyribonuclease n=1 Tax=Columba livia TaxID=8932 RepID=A0A2I0LUA2_COLLI|nr:deoxyribonuclease gamma [Columba livia]PKK21009.1 deoxyribonuclease I-like 3 [Columba livia]
MLLFILLSLFNFNTSLSLKICSFNVRSFGEAKIARAEVVDAVVKIISRCDIMLLMEIKENKNRVCPLLVEQLARHLTGPKEGYSCVVSERLGRKSYKEQYVFIYRQHLVSVKQTYQYPDTQPGDEDAFSREPFAVWFQSPKTAVKEFAIIPLHTTPETAVREIDELYDVYLDVKQRWRTENFVLMGDFNAGCSYVPQKQWKNIRLRTHSEFVWLIGDKNDTTVKESTSCPYDRIVVRGQKLIDAVVPHSANIFDFQDNFQLSEEQALGVSDHFPVEFELKAKGGFFNWLKSKFSRKRRPRARRRSSS